MGDGWDRCPVDCPHLRADVKGSLVMALLLQPTAGIPGVRYYCVKWNSHLGWVQGYAKIAVYRCGECEDGQE